MIKVFVADSFHSNKIAEILQELYGPEVKIFCDAEYLPEGFPHGILAQMSESEAKQFENTTTSDGIDVFFLSAKIILQGSIDPKQMKMIHGNPAAKVVAMSVSAAYLQDIQKSDYGVDYLHSKYEFANNYAGAEQLSDGEKEKLFSYLPKQEA